MCSGKLPQQAVKKATQHAVKVTELRTRCLHARFYLRGSTLKYIKEQPIDIKYTHALPCHACTLCQVHTIQLLMSLSLK